MRMPRWLRKQQVASTTHPPAPKREGDYFGYVYGYRSFREDSPGLLQSPMRSYTWVPGVNEAKCIHAGSGFDSRFLGDHQMKQCVCGFYAFWPGALSMSFEFTSEPMAVIRGWGKVEVHRDGFRSEFAQIMAIAVQSTSPASIHRRARLSQNYHCPVEGTTDPARWCAAEAATLNKQDGHSKSSMVSSSITRTDLEQALIEHMKSLRDAGVSAPVITDYLKKKGIA